MKLKVDLVDELINRLSHKKVGQLKVSHYEGQLSFFLFLNKYIVI